MLTFAPTPVVRHADVEQYVAGVENAVEDVLKIKQSGVPATSASSRMPGPEVAGADHRRASANAQAVPTDVASPIRGDVVGCATSRCEITEPTPGQVLREQGRHHFDAEAPARARQSAPEVCAEGYGLPAAVAHAEPAEVLAGVFNTSRDSESSEPPTFHRYHFHAFMPSMPSRHKKGEGWRVGMRHPPPRLVQIVD